MTTEINGIPVLPLETALAGLSQDQINDLAAVDRMHFFLEDEGWFVWASDVEALGKRVCNSDFCGREVALGEHVCEKCKTSWNEGRSENVSCTITQAFDGAKISVATLNRFRAHLGGNAAYIFSPDFNELSGETLAEIKFKDVGHFDGPFFFKLGLHPKLGQILYVNQSGYSGDFFTQNPI